MCCRLSSLWFVDMKVLSDELDAKAGNNEGCKRLICRVCAAIHIKCERTYGWETCLEYETLLWWLSTYCQNTRVSENRRARNEMR